MSLVKVLYIITTLDVGGAEKQLVELVTHLDRSRFAPVVCSLAPGGLLENELRTKSIPVKAFALHDRRKAFRLSRFWDVALLVSEWVDLVRFIRQERPAIVQGVLFEAYVLGTFAAKAAGVPIIVTTRRSLGHFKAAKRPYRLLERAANTLTDVVIANSEAVRRDALQNEGLPADRVVVIYNGLDIDRYGLSPDSDRRRALGLIGRGPVVGVVANFIHYKGHQYFLEAWREVLKTFPAGAALLIGDGPLRRRCEAAAARMGLGHSLRFLGTRHDVPALLTLVDLIVHPSLEEGFSNAILEGMAAGRPLVATNVGGNPEAVADRETGGLVPPGDSRALAGAMLGLLRHPATAARFGAAGRLRVAWRFGLFAMVRQYEALYEHLLARRAEALAVPEAEGSAGAH